MDKNEKKFNLRNFFEIRKFNFSKILKFEKIKKIPWILGKHAFLTVLALILIAILIGSALFLKFIFLSDSNATVSASPIKFKESTYLKILSELEKREVKVEFPKETANPTPSLEKEILPTPAVSPVLTPSPSPSPTFSPSPSPTARPSPTPNYTVYTTSQGETLWAIAVKFLGSGFRWKEIKSFDGKTFSEEEAYKLLPIMKLLVPQK